MTAIDPALLLAVWDRSASVRGADIAGHMPYRYQILAAYDHDLWDAAKARLPQYWYPDRMARLVDEVRDALEAA